MRSIWKFKLNNGKTSISAKIYKWLNVGTDPFGDFCVWAVVDPDADAAHTDFYEVNTYGTGWEVEEKLENQQYLGTVNDGPYMWHFFAVKVNDERELEKSYDYDDSAYRDYINDALNNLIPRNGGLVLG